MSIQTCWLWTIVTWAFAFFGALGWALVGATCNAGSAGAGASDAARSALGAGGADGCAICQPCQEEIAWAYCPSLTKSDWDEACTKHARACGQDFDVLEPHILRPGWAERSCPLPTVAPPNAGSVYLGWRECAPGTPPVFVQIYCW